MRILLVVFLFTSMTANLLRATEIEGDAARNIVVGGKVLGMTLFDEFFKEIMNSRAGFIYSVLHDHKVWYCYNSREIGWFCETVE